MGVASCRCVRPVLMIGWNWSALADREERSRSRAGSRSSLMAIADDRWMAVGITSLEDWHLLTWSFGWTFPSPSSWLARVAITSLALVLVSVVAVSCYKKKRESADPDPIAQ